LQPAFGRPHIGALPKHGDRIRRRKALGRFRRARKRRLALDESDRILRGQDGQAPQSVVPGLLKCRSFGHGVRPKASHGGHVSFAGRSVRLSPFKKCNRGLERRATAFRQSEEVGRPAKIQPGPDDLSGYGGLHPPTLPKGGLSVGFRRSG
jgi:hypothetical protein